MSMSDIFTCHNIETAHQLIDSFRRQDLEIGMRAESSGSKRAPGNQKIL